MELRLKSFWAVCFAAAGVVAQGGAPDLGAVLENNKNLSTFHGLLKVKTRHFRWLL